MTIPPSHSDEWLRWIVDVSCPACGNTALFVTLFGNITCSWSQCPNPDYAKALRAELNKREVAARIDTIAQIFGVKTEGIIDDGDLFIKRRPLEDKIVELIGYEAFKAIQESIDAAQLHKEQPHE